MTVLVQQADSPLDLQPDCRAKLGLSSAPPDLQKALGRTPKHLPCRFLYDDEGSRLFTRITEQAEYYPYNAERELLKTQARDIVRHVPSGSVIVELGVGDASKTGFLLDALLERDGPQGVTFCGIDCSAEALNQARDNLALRCPGLASSNLSFIEAEYVPGVAAARRAHPDALLCLLWLGSSVGNFSREEVAGLVRQLAAEAGECSQLLLATDLWKDEAVLRLAYDDPAGVTRDFIKNGMRHALTTMGVAEELAGVSNWDYEAQVNPVLQQVEMWLVAKKAVPAAGIVAGERVLMEISRKFTREKIADLAHRAGLCLQAAWGDSVYRITLLLPPRQALLRCWADSDSIFGCITDWGAKPISLRHPFCFYYGHFAAFLKLKLLPQDGSSGMEIMSSRGIDPLVHDPTQCHSHPDVPTTWPHREELIHYVDQTRRKVLHCLEGEGLDSEALHALSMGLEHERMHQETLCYMMAQQRKADYLAYVETSGSAPVIQFPPPACAVRGAPLLPSSQELQPFYLQQCSYATASLSLAAPSLTKEPGTPSANGHHGNGGVHAPTTPGSSHRLRRLGELEGLVFVDVPCTKVQLGLGADTGSAYAWDNELGQKAVQVAPFRLASAPITVRQFREFVLTHKMSYLDMLDKGPLINLGYQSPELWEPTDYKVMLSSCCSGIPMPATWSLDPASQGAGDILVHMPEATYTWQEVADCPVYVSLAEATAFCRRYGGRVMTEAEYAAASTLGGGAGVVGLQSGGWEWTASELEPLPGFKPNPLYPEYSTDFFDGCHYVLKGSCPYTHPSMRRASFRNFYQRSYPYVFAKFRLVQDLPHEGVRA